MAGLNPQITSLEVGIKSLREVTIYPLSMADQFKMTDTIVVVFQEFASLDAASFTDEEIVEKAVTMIEDNITALLKLVLSEGEEVSLSDITNSQFSDLVTIIYDVNYDQSIKKFQDLIKKVKAVLPKTKKQVSQ